VFWLANADAGRMSRAIGHVRFADLPGLALPMSQIVDIVLN
jgi:hypothetical protein